MYTKAQLIILNIGTIALGIWLFVGILMLNKWLKKVLGINTNRDNETDWAAYLVPSLYFANHHYCCINSLWYGWAFSYFLNHYFYKTRYSKYSMYSLCIIQWLALLNTLKNHVYILTYIPLRFFAQLTFKNLVIAMLWWVFFCAQKHWGFLHTCNTR